MSKNVAVFVDVANIFYAAKAAGVDIDYVTLLKSATAGRDFVRAYAYTGLDPENENQRQFHSFLARSGYKVVSKDIRKYGDGRIKANLDIELVVDMMRIAQHIDIAVVVSGDGDFAPAIRAVQQLGVRCRGHQLPGQHQLGPHRGRGRLHRHHPDRPRGEGRPQRPPRGGEDDLSMTEVPDKETEGGTRRRRGGRRVIERPEREERGGRLPVAATGDGPVAMPGNLIVLPGEKLSRAVGERGGGAGRRRRSGPGSRGRRRSGRRVDRRGGPAEAPPSRWSRSRSRPATRVGDRGGRRDRG